MGEPLLVVLMGLQGAGKGEQAKFIHQTYHIPHISTGDLFRAMKTRDDTLAREVQIIMNAGHLINDELTNKVVVERLEQPDCANGAILDGYPRTTPQAEFFDQYLAQRGLKLKAVLYLEIDPFIAFKRAFGRVTAANNDSYNIYYRNDGLTVDHAKAPNSEYPPKVVATLDTGEVLKRRTDDADAHAVIVRIETYLLETAEPLMTHYTQQGRLLRRVNANQPIETVSATIRSILDE